MRRVVLFFCVFSLLIQAATAQAKLPDIKYYASIINDKDFKVNEELDSLMTELIALDSSQAMQSVAQLENLIDSKNYYAQARAKCLRARILLTKHNVIDTIYNRPILNVSIIRDKISTLYSEAIDLAYRTEDDYLVAYISCHYGISCMLIGETGLAVMYLKNAMELYEKHDYPIIASYYQIVGELMYKVREYNESIQYAKKAVDAWRNSKQEHKPSVVSCINTAALGYHRRKIYDSAFIHYNQALHLAKEINNSVWIGIVSGNMAQIYYTQGKYDTAYSMLMMDYTISRDAKYYDNAANSLQWAARCENALGNKSSALAKVREAIMLLKLWPDASYLRNAYFTYYEIFRSTGNYDSAFYYSNLYTALNDSLEKVVVTSSLAISKAKLDNEINRYNIVTLNKQKRSQIQFRNILIAGIIVLSLIALLVVNRQRLKQKLKTESVEQEKRLMEQEISSAKAQMKMFTANIIEKTNLIEKLEEQVQGKQASAEQQAIISELSQQTILTEDDWIRFKSLFERIYPGFFIKLKEKSPDITIAEQRMAALTRLHLSTRQIASMLGISVDSVHKSRQRLRQRFQVGSEASLEEIVASI